MPRAVPCCKASNLSHPPCHLQARGHICPLLQIKVCPICAGRKTQGQAPHTSPSCLHAVFTEATAEATPPPLTDQLKDPPAPLLPPSPFFFCTESRRAGVGNNSSLVSEPVLFPVPCQNLFCFPTQGVGSRPHPAARGMGDVVWFFCHSDIVFLATITM